MLPTWLLVTIFSVVRSFYVSIFGGVFVFFLWNGLCNFDYFLTYKESFLIIFVLDIGFSFFKIARTFKEC